MSSSRSGAHQHVQDPCVDGDDLAKERAARQECQEALVRERELACEAIKRLQREVGLLKEQQLNAIAAINGLCSAVSAGTESQESMIRKLTTISSRLRPTP